MKTIIKYLSLFFFSLNIYANGSSTDRPRLHIVATDSIIADWIKNVSNNTIHLITLVGPDTDNHTFEPTTKDVEAIAQANIIFENGLGLEFWLNGLYKSSASKANRVILGNSVKNLLKANCHGEEHGHLCHHHDFDPHIWLNVDNAITMVKVITEILVKKDPHNAKEYEALSHQYIDKLRSLDAWIFEQVKKIPLANRKLITNHNSFAYFANRYGFVTLGDILGSTSTENNDPSGSHFAELVKIIRKNKVPAIFGLNTQNTALINNLAAEAKLPKPKLLYADALSKENGPAKNYIEMMEYNVKTLVESLEKQ